jgi:LacI family transcriptional regulator
MARLTIADVARAAGVSKSTVSRVLNGGEPHLRDETRARVMQAITALEYRPSQLARSLALKRSQTLGLLISDISDPFYGEIILGMEDIALADGYDLFLCNTMYDTERGMRFVRSLIDKQVDGVLVVTTSLDDGFVEELIRHQIPFVALDWPAEVVKGRAGIVTVDFEQGIGAAVEHLVQLGHRSMALVNGPAHLRTSLRKHAAFFAALSAHSLDGLAAVVEARNMRIEDGRQAFHTVWNGSDRRPTAIVAANDMLAIGVQWAARNEGVALPQALSIVGFGDMPLASQISLPLTTIALARYELGAIMMRMLLDLLPAGVGDWPGSTPCKLIETQLVVRKSTASAPACGVSPIQEQT